MEKITPTLPRYVSKNREKIIIENKDNHTKHERRKERVESRYFGLIVEKNQEKCNAKKPYSAPISQIFIYCLHQFRVEFNDYKTMVTLWSR